ncbi:bifunctional 3-(3-hydroxy-phenyl)propionate/3-hydroxycinnamic acid hydroxylase MhpA [Nocardioides nitrophenolicus]|uniref:bifunctional 3-(3-hydroxy-phenyl)propionate/3-hydroxycinnamic acid hydroxylase MhpA n=1 Tax=Nocardioides nitrophenolicus TaxID=60489 RepID=UPI001959EA50|nr:bifunctional 3-(3-hydroxy-phenyl)propionate/3-hydroxycinnamic acid hydroxylase [Nocardioides nitrophenolicus]MBM7517088.1 3-(3-hydroxy-phenyl)propionate hydroxylase [Nocardioides nitrophenolicus]
MSVEQPEAVVVGAGPTGVTAAILLAQAGVPTLVLDRWPEVFPQPRAVHFDDEVHRILAGLGVAEQVAALTIPGAGLRLLSSGHATLAQFDRTDPRTANGYPQANMFDQPDLEAVLRARMHELPLVTFRGGVEATAVRPGGADRPEVEYVDLGTREVHRVRPRFVLGCDGAISTVRAAIGSTMRDLGFAEQRWLVVDVATPRELGHWGGVHQVCDSTRAATYMRIGATRHRWEFALLDHETPADYRDLDALAPLLAPWDTDLTDFEVVRLAEYTFRAGLADRWQRDGVFVLGDAAHLTPPFIGQGMGAGIRDAANLAWKIAAVVDGRLPAEILDSYEAERAPHARAMIRLAGLVGRAMTAGGPAGDRLRGVAVPLLVHLPGVRGRVLDSTTPALSRSALVDRGRLGLGLPGRLCPNPVLPSGDRLDAVGGHRFVLVSREAPAGRAAERLHALGGLAIDATEAPELDRWLGRHQAALVRPDRTVLAVGSVAGVLGHPLLGRAPDTAGRRARSRSRVRQPH